MKYTKDYYQILEVRPTATEAEIKKSYRKLARQYHPDKNFGNQLFEAKFKEIIEAYKVLSDTKKRDDYNRVRNKSWQNEPKQAQPAVTPLSILNQALDFRKKILLLDPDRMNKLALFQQIQHLLSRSNIALLQHNNDPVLNKRIIDEILVCSRFLPYTYVETICLKLTAIAGNDNDAYRKIYSFSKEIRRKTTWNNYKVLVALLFAILLCFAIFLASNI